MSGKYSTGWQPWDSESVWDCYSCTNLNNCDHVGSYTCSGWTDMHKPIIYNPKFQALSKSDRNYGEENE